jgi:8-amino-7-oxononanoate synthase
VPVSWPSWAGAEQEAITVAGRWRTIRTLDGGGPVIAVDGGEVISFASNDYLGLSRHPAVRAAAHEAIERWGTGAGSARLVAGSRPVHCELEHEIAEWKRAERALLFPTGYAANLGVLSVAGGPGVTIISDQLNHASIVDGCRLARGEVRIYRHGDAGHAAELLKRAGRAVVVTDAVFSMDGDAAPVAELARLCAAHDALLVLDEAHAVLGPAPPLEGPMVRVGTLSKMLGSVGGFAAGPAPLVDLLINRARPFIFTTAPAPADTAAALAALRVLRSAAGGALTARLRALTDRVRPGHPSPIIPVLLGGESAAVTAAEALLARGLLVPAIRPPAVPPGTSRLRVALSAAHTDEHLSRLLEGLAAVAPT